MDKNKTDKKCCTNSNVTGEGTSLLTRVLPMLDPAHSPIDHYSTQDILVFAKHYADMVRYYDLDDSIEWVDFEAGIITRPCNEAENSPHQGKPEQSAQQYKKLPSNKNQIITWKEFFYQDIAVVVASISRWEKKLPEIKKEYNRYRRETELNPTRENFRQLFLTIIHHLKRIDRWYQRSVYNHPLKAHLEVQIKSFLAPALKQLISYDKGMILNVADDLDLVTRYEIFKNDTWEASFDAIAPDDSVYVGNNIKQKIIYSLMYVDDIFNTMYKTYEEITKRSAYYWEQAMEKFPTHQPHMALFISFVELFSYVRKELNNLTGRHLDFFYRDILHLKEKPARPDSVYLIYQLAKGVDEFDLKEGREFTAGKDSLGKQLIYKTDKELVINKAQIKELKTVFLDIGSPIKNIYASPVANSADGKGEKFKDPETAWPTFGYFEPRGDLDKSIGEKPEMGFAIASSLLYLTGGERKINIHLQLSFPRGNTIAEDVKKQISESKFKIYFTGEKDWIQPLEEEGMTTIKFEGDALIFQLIIQSQQDPLVTPGKDFKNFNFNTEYPLCKIILDADARVYDILQNASISDIKIQSEVIGLTNIIIENDDGILDPKKPAFLFTGFPKVGSSFSVGSPDLKDKQLESLVFGGEWIGELDFANRYIRYDFDTTDTGPDRKNPESFKCSVDLFQDKAWTPLNPELLVNLFSVVAGKAQNSLLLTVDQNSEVQTSLPGAAIAGNNYQFARFRLSQQDFGHEIYPVLTAFQLANQLNKSGIPVKDVATDEVKATPEKAEALKKATGAPKKAADVTKEADIIKKEPDAAIKKGPGALIEKEPDALIKKDLGFITKKVADIMKPPAIFIPPLSFPPPKPEFVFIPNPPYTPHAKSFSLSYSSVPTTLTPANSQLFHIYPFGETEIFLHKPLTGIAPINPVAEKVSVIRRHSSWDYDNLIKREKETSELIIPTSLLLPQFKFGVDEETADTGTTIKRLTALRPNNKSKIYFHLNQYASGKNQQGNLYIGIKDLEPPQNLSLLFKFADGSAYDNDGQPPKIHWSYLVNNEWYPLPPDHVITDSTYDFQTTGIILFDFPDDATNNNTILTTGLYWLCASIENDAGMVPKLIDVVAQANQATFFDQQNDPVHYSIPLPAKTISKPVVKIPEIKTTVQPFESFDGKRVEEPKQFYQRVSERLRHKGRAITASDYEHLVLEEFPSVYKVKVLSHTDPLCLCRPADTETPHKKFCCCPQVAPGHVLVVAVSNLRNKNAVDPLKPRTGRRTLLKIEEFLKKKVSPFVRIHAKNPKFEEVKVGFNVKFYTGIDKGFYLKKLNDDIINYLTPWAYDSNVEIAFGNKIYASKIIDFIEGLEYVDYITCFRMIQIAEGCCKSLPDMDCSEMHADLTKEPASKANELKARFINEVSAKSSQAILVSAKQHCIDLIEDEPFTDDCNCREKNKNKK